MHESEGASHASRIPSYAQGVLIRAPRVRGVELICGVLLPNKPNKYFAYLENSTVDFTSFDRFDRLIVAHIMIHLGPSGVQRRAR